MNPLSERLADRKSRQEWSLDDITRRARGRGHSIDRATINRYLRGEVARWPSERVILALAAGFEMDEREVRELAGAPAGERELWEPTPDAAKLTRSQRSALDLLIKAIVRPEVAPNGHEPDSNEQVTEQTGAASATNVLHADNGDGSQLGVRGRTARLRRSRGPDSRGSEQADATTERTPGQPAPPVV